MDIRAFLFSWLADMCGIHLKVRKNTCFVCQEIFSEEEHNLRRRGPDACQKISIDDVGDGLFQEVRLQASVLQMRKDLVTQPVQVFSSDGDVSNIHDINECYLCWNGEVYETSEKPDIWNYETSDTLLVAKQLQSIIRSGLTADQDPTNLTTAFGQEVAKIMGRLTNAEFAFLILTNKFVCYGRDVWGRRSLLRWDCPNKCGSFQIVSAAEVHNTDEQQEHWTEILPGMVHSDDFLFRQDTNNSGIVHPSVQTTFPIAYSSAPSFESWTPKSLSSDFPPAPNGVSDELWKASIELEYHLKRAVRIRLDTIRSSAVLFSGGLDSAVVAALAASCSSNHPVTLYNVSFGPSYEKSADRQAALITGQSLQARYSNIVYEDIIVEWEEICQYEPHIRTLLQPKTTLMDVNIATALWFASRGGKSEVMADGSVERPRVLLLGMGADEQMGGYGRHRKAFERGGLEELKNELKMDQARFWERNLGRDDRICADHGKEARFPFLDANVVQFLKTLPLNLVCDFSLPPGEGDKRILRLLAMRLGLDHASGLVKRAIQFGSRISHLSDAKRFGSRRKAKGQATVKVKNWGVLDSS